MLNVVKMMPTVTIESVSNLSVLVITHAGIWRDEQFHPSSSSPYEIEWFEGTGTIIGTKRNRVFIISSIHCNPTSKYSFFIKGRASHHMQIKATVVENHFIAENNGIDVAVFSCDIDRFDNAILNENLQHLHWKCCYHFPQSNSIWLIHFPTLNEDENTGNVSTERLFSLTVQPTISTGTIISTDWDMNCFDSTIIATGGSSGGLIINEEGFIIGVHDSQNNENNLLPGQLVSTHRMAKELRDILGKNRQIQHIFDF